MRKKESKITLYKLFENTKDGTGRQKATEYLKVGRKQRRRVSTKTNYVGNIMNEPGLNVS